MAEPIYKITTKADWSTAVADGELRGTAVDLADGYVHFSTAQQLAETLSKHYRGQSGLVLATIDPDLLPTPIKWEPSRGGALFPHLYAPLPMTAVTAHRELDAQPDGSFDLGDIG